jgi:hypothetical protein
MLCSGDDVDGGVEPAATTAEGSWPELPDGPESPELATLALAA